MLRTTLLSKLYRPLKGGHYYRIVASLEKVERGEMYCDEDLACTGLLFIYLDITHESIDQHRIGLEGTRILHIESPKWALYQEIQNYCFRIRW